MAGGGNRGSRGRGLGSQDLFYVDVQDDAAKTVTAFVYLIHMRDQRSLVMVSTMERARELHGTIKQAFGSSAVGLADGEPPPRDCPCLVVGADGRTLPREIARDYPTLILFDMPCIAQTFVNWVLKSYCNRAICFLVAEPERQKTEENAVLDALEADFGAEVKSFPDHVPEKDILLARAAEWSAEGTTGAEEENLRRDLKDARAEIKHLESRLRKYDRR